MDELTPRMNKIIERMLDEASTTEQLTIAYWDIFCPKKRNELIKYLELGTSWRFAYQSAKNLKNKKHDTKNNR